MTGPTHKQYSICFAYLAAMLFFLLGITEVNYYLALPILIASSKYGAEFPDVDHAWVNVHNKTVINRIINFIIHLTKGSHRSWQTHSIDICFVFTVLSCVVPKRLYINGDISKVNSEVMMLLFLGFASGWISHLYSDMLTSEGVRLFCWGKFKLKFVPKKLGKLKFNTGNEWEAFNFNLMKKVNVVLGIICVFYPVILANWDSIKSLVQNIIRA